MLALGSSPARTFQKDKGETWKWNFDEEVPVSVGVEVNGRREKLPGQ